MKARAILVLLLGALVFLVAVPAALAALTVTRAELNGGQLRVEGNGAAPSAAITIDGTAMGTADSGGRFRIERSGFSSSTCRITVSDGVSSTQATPLGLHSSAAATPATPGASATPAARPTASSRDS
jgi:hypothetical protein